MFRVMGMILRVLGSMIGTSQYVSLLLFAFLIKPLCVVRYKIGWLTREKNGKTYNPWLAYGQSKTANILFAKSLTQRLKKRDARAYVIHPGRTFIMLSPHFRFPSPFILPQHHRGVSLTFINIEANTSQSFSPQISSPTSPPKPSRWASRCGRTPIQARR